MNFTKAIISYLPHKRTENARNKKIIFFAIMKPFKTKKGLISWKTTQTITKRH
ncbi:type I restriction endonuclease [Helicobacter pylori]